jgi:hypothetical protein
VIKIGWRVHYVPAELSVPAFPLPFVGELPADWQRWVAEDGTPARTPYLISPAFTYDVELNAFFRSATMCQASFLECFHCGNCLITVAHLPRILALLTALQARREQLPEQQWWERYGQTWAAIRHDVLPKFSPAELAQAGLEPHVEALLDLVEPPWEHP